MDVFWQLLDLRSFPSLWYWLFMVAVWLIAIQRPLGVSYGMIEEAYFDPKSRTDVMTLAQMNARRLLRATSGGGATPVLIFIVLGGMAVLGFGYDFRFAQAVSLIAWPLVWVFYLAVGVAGRVRNNADSDAVLRILRWHRYTVLAIASVSMVFSLLWGTLHNILDNPFF